MTKQTLVSNLRLFGLKFSTGDISSLTHTVLHWLNINSSNNLIATHSRLISFINPHVYNLSMNDVSVQRCLETSDRICIDGVGIKLAVSVMQRQRVPRVVAEHLFNNLIEQLANPVSAVMIGATSEEVSMAATALTKHNAHLAVVDTLNGFSQPETYRRFLEQHADVQLVLIGAGTPKSEQIALAAMQECHRSVVMHIGAGTIKTWAGTKRRGPALMSSFGLEWLHRIVFEPHTRARYTVGALTFARNLAGRKPVMKNNTIKREQS